MDGGEGVQVGHRELQAPPPQILVHTDHTSQRGRATECIGPRLRDKQSDRDKDRQTESRIEFERGGAKEETS